MRRAVAIAAAFVFRASAAEPGGLTPPVARQVADAKQAAAREPSNPMRVGAVGMTLHAHEQFASADRWYERAASIDPRSPQWPYLRGVVAFVRGDTDAALAYLRNALRRSPTDVTVLLRLAEYEHSRGNLVAAKAAAENVLQLHSEATVALFLLGRIALEEGSASDALALLRRVEHDAPDHKETQYALALAYRRLGQAKDAESHERRFRTLPPGRSSWPDPYLDAVAQRRTAIPQSFLESALECEKKGDLACAIRNNKQALQIDSEFAQVHINLISAYGKLGNADAVAVHYQEGLRLMPRSFELHYNYGVFLLNAGKADRAVVAFRTACEVNPQSAAAYQNLGHALELLKQIEEAVEMYRKALSIEPGYRLSHVHLGRWFLKSGSADLARFHFQAALNVKDPEEPKYTYLVANAYYQSGDRDQAIKYAKRAHELALHWSDAKLAEQINSALKLLTQ